MKGTIMNFRRGMHRVTGNQLIVKVDGIEKKEKAASLVGKSVSWIAPGKKKKELKGRITQPHGNKGAVRALFETGLPGQCLGEKVEIIR